MNLIVYPLLVVWTLLCVLVFPVCFLLTKIGTRWSNARIMRWFIWIYGRGWRTFSLPFMQISREGFTSENSRPPAILIVNHLSFFDTYCMCALPYSNISFAVRAWPFRMFWYAPFMRLADYLNVEEVSWEQTLELSKKILGEGGSILFFPEGHRSRDGRLQRFYSGPFRIAIETGVPVVPICITGSDILLPPGRSWLLPARIHLAALPPVSPQNYSGQTAHIELRKAIKKAMWKKIQTLRTPLQTENEAMLPEIAAGNGR